MTLQDKLNALKVKFETEMAPPEAVAVLHRVTDELIASGQAGRALQAGDHAPAFTLPDPDGKLVSSQDLLARGPVVLTFYRGAWCPFCNLDLQALEGGSSEISLRGPQLRCRNRQQPTAASPSATTNSVSPSSATRAANWPPTSEFAGTCRRTCKPFKSSSAPISLPSTARTAGRYPCRLDTSLDRTALSPTRRSIQTIHADQSLPTYSPYSIN